ncbi:PEP-CTERM sorting domain-containing protein [Rubritalea spongiae]|uniref:PEP-CTERM sorting domain-containing protein n=1 Tax=Rubritalea spongiae TaxID=430797 RepID=A0ABW5E021_9BACT
MNKFSQIALITTGLSLASAQAATLVGYEHTAGSTTPDILASGITSTSALGGSLNGTIATTIDQLSAAGANGLPNSAGQTSNYYFSYVVTGSNVTYESLDLAEAAKVGTRDFRLAYSIDGGSEVEIQGWTGSQVLGSQTVNNYDFADFTTSDSVEFRIYWGGSANNNGNARVYSDSFTLNGSVAVPEPSSTALLGLGGLALILRRRK